MSRAVWFWSAALGYRPHGTTFDPNFMMLVDQSGTGLPGSLQKAESPPKEPVRLRLDLYSDDQDRQVSRLVGLGATRVEHWLYPGDADFVTRHRVSEGVGALRMTRPRLLAVPAA